MQHFNANHTRANWINGLGNCIGLNIDGINFYTVDNYNEFFPLGKYLVLITSDRFELTETIAIYSYIMEKPSKPEIKN